MKKSESIGQLALALSKAQGQIKNAVKDSENPHFKSKYADLASIWDACRLALSANEIAVIQSPSETETGISVASIMIHSSGEWIEESLCLHPRDGSPQSAGSAITYARRYLLSAMVGVAPDDDDGNAASMPDQNKADFKKLRGSFNQAMLSKDTMAGVRAVSSELQRSHGKTIWGELTGKNSEETFGLLAEDHVFRIKDMIEAWPKRMRSCDDKAKLEKLEKQFNDNPEINDNALNVDLLAEIKSLFL